jgi:hypothetical protein
VNSMSAGKSRKLEDVAAPLAAEDFPDWQALPEFHKAGFTNDAESLEALRRARADLKHKKDGVDVEALKPFHTDVPLSAEAHERLPQPPAGVYALYSDLRVLARDCSGATHGRRGPSRQSRRTIRGRTTRAAARAPARPSDDPEPGPLARLLRALLRRSA